MKGSVSLGGSRPSSPDRRTGQVLWRTNASPWRHARVCGSIHDCFIASALALKVSISGYSTWGSKTTHHPTLEGPFQPGGDCSRARPEWRHPRTSCRGRSSRMLVEATWSALIHHPAARRCWDYTPRNVEALGIASPWPGDQIQVQWGRGREAEAEFVKELSSFPTRVLLLLSGLRLSSQRPRRCFDLQIVKGLLCTVPVPLFNPNPLLKLPFRQLGDLTALMDVMFNALTTGAASFSQSFRLPRT